MMNPDPPVSRRGYISLQPSPRFELTGYPTLNPRLKYLFGARFASVLFLLSLLQQVGIKGLGSAPTLNLLIYLIEIELTSCDALKLAGSAPLLLMPHEQY